MAKRKKKKGVSDKSAVERESDPGAFAGGEKSSEDEGVQSSAESVAVELEDGEQETVNLESVVAELEEIQDRYLRLAAEYDNYRKRTSKELAHAGVRAQAFLVGRLLDALDDLGRVAHVDPTGVDAKDVLEGVELVERKMLHELEALGLERIGVVGQPFDPNDHEAIGALPAESLEHDNTVAHVLQLGYRLGPTLIRPARVQVYTWQDKAGSETEE